MRIPQMKVKWKIKDQIQVKWDYQIKVNEMRIADELKVKWRRHSSSSWYIESWQDDNVIDDDIADFTIIKQHPHFMTWGYFITQPFPQGKYAISLQTHLIWRWLIPLSFYMSLLYQLMMLKIIVIIMIIMKMVMEMIKSQIEGARDRYRVLVTAWKVFLHCRDQNWVKNYILTPWLKWQIGWKLSWLVSKMNAIMKIW